MNVKATVLALADTDSYLKWTSHAAQSLGDQLQVSLALVRSPLQPSPEQVEAAVAGTVWEGADLESVHWIRVVAMIRRTRPDVVLLGMTGALVRLLTAAIRRAGLPVVIVTGMAGLSYPANLPAIRYRAGCDLFVVHSPREQFHFEALARANGATIPKFVTHHLPYLPESSAQWPLRQLPPVDHTPVQQIVFAAQAKVPSSRRDRAELLRRLAAVAETRPDIPVLVKLRSRGNEAQTHTELHPLDKLWEKMAVAEDLREDALQFVHGPMRPWLTPGTVLVTVSSTASLESLALGIRTMIVDDFGVSDELINTVFQGSGLLGSLSSLPEAGDSAATQRWMESNYFHGFQSDLVRQIDGLIIRARNHALDVPRSQAINPPGAIGWSKVAVWVLLPTSLRSFAVGLVRRMRERKNHHMGSAVHRPATPTEIAHQPATSPSALSQPTFAELA